jgi:5-methylthioadenosine/S-adenosylhomocysteine deaminase
MRLGGCALANVVHCPFSNLKLASGFCPVAKLLSAGVNVCVGTDSVASNNELSMLSEVKVSAALAKAVANDARAVPVDVAIQMATLNGARAFGLDAHTGSLLPGKSADFIAVSLAGIEHFPVFNAVTHLIYSADRSQCAPAPGPHTVRHARLTVAGTHAGSPTSGSLASACSTTAA